MIEWRWDAGQRPAPAGCIHRAGCREAARVRPREMQYRWILSYDYDERLLTDNALYAAKVDIAYSSDGRLGHACQSGRGPVCSPVELTVEGDGGVDQSQVRECLGEVAELPAG